MIESVLT